MRPQDRLALFKLIPPKLALALIALAIIYFFGQPIVNSKFGWNLPSLASLLEGTPDDKQAPEKPKPKPTSPAALEQENTPKSNSPSSANEATAKKDSPKQTTTSEQPQKKTTAVDPTRPERNELLHGVLKEIGKDRYISPEGLVYGPGSEEGHRLKHIERHLRDQPSRPGSHGVFEGDMQAFLTAIDNAYSRASRGAKGTQKREEDGSMVYEASFDKPIGFVGGSSGKNRGNPTTKRLRIVVSGKNLITAFPF